MCLWIKGGGILKIQMDFVTNSSSTAFCIIGIAVDDTNHLQKMLYSKYNSDGNSKIYYESDNYGTDYYGINILDVMRDPHLMSLSTAELNTEVRKLLENEFLIPFYSNQIEIYTRYTD